MGSRPISNPDTEYEYELTVKGEPWADGERRDWVFLPNGKQGMLPNKGRYENAFRTYPSAEQPLHPSSLLPCSEIMDVAYENPRPIVIANVK